MGSDADPKRFSPYRYAAIRVGLAFYLVAIFLWPTEVASPPWPDLAEGFRELPHALRGGLRLLGLAAAVALCLGVFRRPAALSLLIPLLFFVAYGRLHLGFAVAAAALALAVSAYPGVDLRLGALDEAIAASPQAIAVWFPAVQVASVVALAFAGLSAMLEPSPGNVGLALFATLLAALSCFDERWLPPVDDVDAIVFFDGRCDFCNSTVRFIIGEEQRPSMTFAPLEGDTARTLVGAEARVPDGTIVFRVGGQNHVASDAALRIARAMGGFWRLFWILRLVPRDVRDAAYNAFARNRYRWFGRLDSCPVPPVQLRSRYLP